MKKNIVLSYRLHASPVLLFLVLSYILLLSSLAATPASAGTVKDEEVTFNFVDVELSTVTKFISEITGKNFIFDDRVKGNITIIAPSKLNVDDAYNLFTSILELKGFTVVPSGVDAYKIIPVAEAKQKGIKISYDGQPVNESYIARLVTLKNISSDDALRLIKPIVSMNGYVSDFGPGNMLLVIDSGLNIEKVLSIIDAIDQPSLREEPDIVFLRYSSADAVAKMINEGIGQSRVRGAPGKQSRMKKTKAVADQRLNAVILFGDKGMRESMKSLIAAIDVPSPDAQGMINVYTLENADATELAEVLSRIIKGARPQKKVKKGGAALTPFQSAGGINITADEATNSLVIVASPSDYQNLVRVIKQLDKRRRQVFVEAMIVEASIDKLRELGTKWRVMGTHNGEPIGIGGFGTMDGSALQSLIYGLTGLTGGGMGNYFDIPMTTIDANGSLVESTLSVPGFAALFSMNEFRGAVNVLSTPQLLTSDNQEAEIIVGENVPFISKRERDITTANTVLSSIERKDVGITLRITPQITEGDYVKLDIYQEISSVKQDASDDILISVGPSTTKRSTQTSVVVKDNQTVVIGGLMEERDEENLAKVPVLGDIPVLGWLFKTKSVSKKKTNLLIFITPHVIKDAESLGSITKSKQKEFAKVEKQYVEGEILVKFKEGVTDEAVEEIITGKGVSVIKIMKHVRVYLIKLGEGRNVEDAIREFSLIPEVEYAEPNYKMKAMRSKQR